MEPRPGSVQHVVDCIKSGNVDYGAILSEIMTDPYAMLTDTKVSEFLLNSTNKVLDFALHPQNGNPVLSKAASGILTAKVSNFSTLLTTNGVFFEQMNDFLSQISTAGRASIISWCKIMQFFLDYTGGGFLQFYPEKKHLLESLIPHVSNMAVFQLLYSICDKGHELTTQFLEKCKASMVFYRALGSPHDDKLLKLMACVISSVESPTSNLVLSLAKKERLDKIFMIATRSEDEAKSDAAMNLLLELSSRCDEDDCDEGSLYQLIFMYLVNRVHELAVFVCEGRFSPGRDKAIDLMIGMVATQSQVPNDIFDVLDYLWEILWKYPLQSIAHCAMLRLFKAIMQTDGCPEKFLEVHKIREKIIENSTMRNELSGHLFEVSKTIVESEELENQSEEWRHYVEGSYTQINKLIQQQYGGTVPERHKINFDDMFI